jgi:nitroreductase
MITFLENQNWRYATKKFDATKKISEKDLNYLKESIRLASSSFGLQPYKVLVIENEGIKQELLHAAYGQTQIVDAPVLFIFASQTNLDVVDVDAYFQNLISTREIPLEKIQGYKDYMTNSVTSIPKENRAIWTQKQCYLALGNLLNAAAELKIDACPMEGFVAGKVNEILGLDQLHLSATLIAPVGYRSEEDVAQHYKKVRKSENELFINI